MYVSQTNNEDEATAMNHSQQMQVNVYKSQFVLDRELLDPELEKMATLMHHSQQTQATVYGSSEPG